MTYSFLNVGLSRLWNCGISFCSDVDGTTVDQAGVFFTIRRPLCARPQNRITASMALDAKMPQTIREVATAGRRRRGRSDLRAAVNPTPNGAAQHGRILPFARRRMNLKQRAAAADECASVGKGRAIS